VEKKMEAEMEKERKQERETRREAEMEGRGKTGRNAKGGWKWRSQKSNYENLVLVQQEIRCSWFW
jgi:hypothetical protein